MSTSSFVFRPHLDGLRTVAVALVFVFHAVPSALYGGFIGVDIFFVLSGFLITSIQLARYEAGTHSLLSFYGRRVRRLLPPVVLLLGVVAIYEAVFGSVLERASRFQEVKATLLYYANWNLIWSSDDYFAEGLGLSPLRHMWSLAVEEQFYLVWPILLAVLVKLFSVGKRLTWAILGVSGLSFVAMLITYTPLNVSRAYYGTDSRAFQPLIGAALAVLLYDKAIKEKLSGHKRAVNVISVLASLGLLYCAATFSGESSFYYRGGAIVVAVLTSLVILDGEIDPKSPVTRFLGLSPLVKVGAISYAVYLWHWPIIQWIHSPEGADFSERRLVNVLQLLATLALAGGSHFLLEDPIRKLKVSWKPALSIGALASLLVGFGAHSVLKSPVAVSAADGEISARIAPAVTPTVKQSKGDPVGGGEEGVGATPTATVNSEGSDDPKPTSTPESLIQEVTLTRDEAEVLMASAMQDRSYRPCKENPKPCIKVQGDPGSLTVVMIGDSTSQMYDITMAELAERHGFTYVHAAVGGCPIGHRLLATGPQGERHKPSNHMCFEETPLIYQQILDEYDPDLILATSYNETNQHVEDGEVIQSGTERHLQTTRKELKASIELLTSQGAQWVFIDILPGGPNVSCLEKDQPNTGSCLRSVSPQSRETAYNALFAELVDEYEQVIGKVSFNDQLCPGLQCPLIVDSIVVRYDGGHFTGTQARALVSPLTKQLLGLGIDFGDK